MLSQIVKVHLNTVGKFNMTRSEPKIFWKPSKPLQVTEKSEKIKSSTQKYLTVIMCLNKETLRRMVIENIRIQ